MSPDPTYASAAGSGHPVENRKAAISSINVAHFGRWFQIDQFILPSRNSVGRACPKSHWDAGVMLGSI